MRTVDGAVSFEGRIGKTRVRAWVTIESSLGWSAGSDAYPEGTQYGLFYETDAWLAGVEGASVGVLVGTLTKDCRLELAETDTPGRDGKWSIVFTAPGRATGVHTSPSGVTTPIDFAITHPPGCERAEEWRKFTASSWPVTFDYPAGWRLLDGKAFVLIECPNLEDMATGGHTIELEWRSGHGTLTKADDGREARVIDPFVSFGDDEWLLLADACLDLSREEQEGSVFCTRAGNFSTNGMSVAYGSAGEARLHSPGRGYIGQGGALRFLFRWDRTWLVVRANADVPDPDDPKTPPVRLEGNDVDTRLLRSIRPRRP
jgi:hypothetical protein